jgi:lipoprotein-anchoring transpeptidase ErfK/SrfK
MRRSRSLAVAGWVFLLVEPLAAETLPEAVRAPAPNVQVINKGSQPESLQAESFQAKSPQVTNSQIGDAAAPAEEEMAAGDDADKAAVGSGSAAMAETEPAPPPEPTLHIDINLTSQRMVVTENGKARYTWPVSSGAYGYPTPTGTFQPSWMSKMWYSRQYDNAPMPHSIFFKNGAAIHATNSVHLLGRPASHGCVRVSPSNAAKLYGMVSRHGKERTRIVVHGKPKYAPAPRIASTRPVPPRYRTGRVTYGYSPYSYSGSAPRYVYPGDQRMSYVQAQKRRNAALKKRRVVIRQYYSAY